MAKRKNKDDGAAKRVLGRSGFNKWYLHQEKIIQKLLESSRNILIRAPTSSGKTIAVAVAIQDYIQKHRRVIFAVPLRKLASDKVKELSEYLSEDTKIGRSGRENVWKNADVVVGTFEEIYQTSLNNRSLLDEFGLIIFDDFHILYDRARGFSLEKAITLAKISGLRIIALSATIEPLEVLSEWLDAEPISFGEEVRPFPLDIEKILEIYDCTSFAECLADEIIRMVNIKPALIFCSTKLETESRAKALANRLELKTQITFDDFGKTKISDNFVSYKKARDSFIGKLGRELDEDEEDLAKIIAKGVAWHHADVDNKIKSLIEDWYDKGYIDYLFATTTLAYGFNSPTKTVIIADTNRWYPDTRIREPIGVYEWWQMAGRAGRAGYSKEGRVYTVARSEDKKEEIKEKYFRGKIEECKSNIIEDDVFRKAILELIYTGRNKENEIMDFFSNTYYDTIASQNQIKWLNKTLGDELRDHVVKLHEYGYVKPARMKYSLTDFGKKVVSFLWGTYRWYMLSDIKNLRDEIKQKRVIKDPKEAVSMTLKHLKPLLLYPPKNGNEKIEKYYQERYGKENLNYSDYTSYIVLEEWIENRDIDEIGKEYGRWAIYVKSISKDLSYALKLFKEIAGLVGVDLTEDFDDMVMRVRYGLTKYVLPLINIRYFGRKTINNLYKKIKTIPAIKIEQRDNILDSLTKYYVERGRSEFIKDLMKWEVRYLGEKKIKLLADRIDYAIRKKKNQSQTK